MRKQQQIRTRHRAAKSRLAAFLLAATVATGAWAASLTEADVSSGSLTLAEDSTLTIASATALDALAVSGAYTLTIDSASAATLTLTTLDIGSGTTVKLADGETLSSGKLTATVVTGAGVVAYTGVVPDALSCWADAENWTGTLWVRGLSQNAWNPSSLGNASSTLRLSGYTGYFAQAFISVPFAIELENDSYTYAISLNNGYSYNSTGQAYFATPTLKGSGTFTANTTGGCLFIVTDNWSGFTGTFSLSAKTVWLGCDVPDGTYKSDDVTLGTMKGAIRIASGKEVTITPSSGWTFASTGGFIGEGTVKLLYPWQATQYLATNTNFTGTVELAAHEATSPTSPTAVHLARMGNANSTIVLKGLTSNGGTHYIYDNSAVNATVQLDGDVTIDNGNASQSVTIAKLTGTGNFNALASVSTSIAFIITKLEGYSGVLAAKSGKDTITINEVALSSAPSTGDMIVKVDSSNPAVTIARSEGTFAVTYNGESAGAAVALNTVGEDYGYTITAIRRDVYWIGGASGSWRTASNWALADGTVLSAFPNGDTLGAGDNVIFTNAAEVAIGNGQAVVSKVTVNADVTFKGDSVASGKGLFFDKMTGTGKVTFDGVYVGIISAGSSRNFTIDNDICIASSSQFFTGTLICYANGDISGSGDLTIKCGNNGGVWFYGDNSAYAGTFTDYDTTRNNTGFYYGNATSSNAIFKLNSNQYNINQESTFHDSETYYFGALLEGTFLNGAYRSPTLEVGARDDVASSARLRGRGTTTNGSKFYFNIVKVGSNSFTVTADSSNFGDMEIKGGTLSLPSVPSYGTYVKFTGDGATLTATANEEEVIPELDFSARIMDSTSAICYDTAGSSPTWATALAASNVGGLAKKGAGTLTLSAVPQYSGATRVEAGTLVVPLGTQLADVYVAEGATLTVDLTGATSSSAFLTCASMENNGTVNWINTPDGITPQAVESDGKYFIAMPRTLTWSGAGDDTAWTTAGNWLVGEDVATLAPQPFDSVLFNTTTPGVTLSAAAEVASVTAPNGLTLATAYDLTVYDDFTVTGAFVKSGDGTLSVGGTFAATSAKVTKGALEAGVTDCSSVVFESVELAGNGQNNGTDTIAVERGYHAKMTFGDAVSLSSFSGVGVVEGNGTITVNSDSNQSFIGSLTGDMSFVKEGNGTLTLFGQNSFTGDFTISAGTVKFSTPYDLSGLSLDYDASNEDSVTTESDVVTKWAASHGSNDLTPMTGYSDITVGSSTTLFNGKPYLTSERFGMTPASNGRVASTFMVVAVPSVAGNKALIWNDDDFMSDDKYDSYKTQRFSLYANTSYGIGCFWNYNAENNGIWVNGTYGGTYELNKAFLVSTSKSPIRRGDQDRAFRIGMWQEAKDYDTTMSFGEVLTYNRGLSLEEHDAVDAYLMQKWGIASCSSIPATADVTVAAGATLDLGGQTVTVASLNLSGTIQNGTLVVTGNNLTIAATAKVLATIKVSGYDSSMVAPTGYKFFDNGDGTATVVAVYSWTDGTGDHSWGTPGNWDKNAVPGENDVVVFPSENAPEGGWTVYVGQGTQTCLSMTLSADVTLSLNASQSDWSGINVKGSIDGSGKLILWRSGVNNFAANPVTISCPLVVKANGSDSFLQKVGFNVTGAVEVNSLFVVYDATEFSGAVTLNNGAVVRSSADWYKNNPDAPLTFSGTITVPANATVSFERSSQTITGAVTMGAGSTFTLSSATTATEATFTLGDGAKLVVPTGASVTAANITSVAGGDTIASYTSGANTVYVNNTVATWVGGTSGSWNTGSNWSTGAVPNRGTDVTFQAGDATTVTTGAWGNGNAFCKSLAINRDVTFDGGYVTSDSDITGKGTMTLSNWVWLNTWKGATMNINVGKLVVANCDFTGNVESGNDIAVLCETEVAGTVYLHEPVAFSGGISVPAGSTGTIAVSDNGAATITGTVTLEGADSTLTVPAGANVSGATFTTSVSGYEVSLDGNVYRVMVDTTVAPNATSIEYATEEEATTAAAGYTVALTAEQTEQGLLASYYTTAVVPGATEGTYVVTAVLADEVKPKVDEGVTVSETTVTLPVTNLKRGLCYRVVSGSVAGELTTEGEWSDYYDGENAPELTATLPESGVLYYSVEASDTK